MNASIIIALVIFAFVGGWFFAIPQSSGSTLVWILFFVIGGLTLASFWIPPLRILSSGIASIVLFYGWITSGNNWFLVGAIALAIPVVVSLMKLMR